jgi:hypothetical protein
MMIHITGSQLNYVTKSSRTTEAMCSVTHPECSGMLNTASFHVR